MVWLPDGEKNVKIRLFVSIEFTNVTDRWTDDGCAGIASRGDKSIALCSFLIFQANKLHLCSADIVFLTIVTFMSVVKSEYRNL